MIKNRLLRLAKRLDYIAKHPPRTRKFSLLTWFNKSTALGCGTTCCAVGEGVLIPEFRKLGFGLKKTAGVLVPRFGRYQNWQAVEKFFRIDRMQAEHLFSWQAYRDFDTSPSDVALRIRNFVAGTD